MPVLAVIFLLLQVSFGFLFSIFLDPEKRLNRAELFFASVVLGLTSSLFLLLSFLLVLRSWSMAIPLLWGLLIAAGIFALWKKLRFIRLQFPSGANLSSIFSPTFWGLLVLLFLYSAIIAGVFFVNEQGLPYSILLGWGDSAYHLDMIGRLKTADPFLLEQPVVSGERLTYPFLINLLSALYERIGFSKLIAWHLPVFLFGISFFSLVFLLGKRIFRNDGFALVLVMLVFFGAGIGFLWFFQDLWVAGHNGGADAVLSTLTDPPHQYTHLDNRTGGKPYESLHNIVWIVPAISFLSHQRSFVSGAPIAMLIFLGFLVYRGSPKLWKWGIVWGMLPLLHTHTFIAISIVILFWFFYDIKNWLAWFKGGFIGIILALPQIIFLMPGKLLSGGGSSFFKPWLGWMTCTHNIKWYACDPNVKGVDSNPFWFWTKNFGFVFWVWVFAICAFFVLKGESQKEYRSETKPFILPSLALFILPNIMLFQPWEFDNNKILFYWWILASICSLFLFQTFFKSRRIIPFIFVIFVTLSIYSGMIDVLARISNFEQNHHGYYGPKEVEIAGWIRENTLPNDSFLTGDQPNQFVPMLTGRSIYIGFSGWLWPQGKKDLIQLRKQRARSFLISGNSFFVCEDGLKYILWDSDLLKTYPGANHERVLSRSNVVFSQNPGSEKREILEIRCPQY